MGSPLLTCHLSVRARVAAKLGLMAQDGGKKVLPGSRSFVGSEQLEVIPARMAKIREESLSGTTYREGLVPDVTVEHPTLGKMPARPGMIMKKYGFFNIPEPGLVPDFATYPTTRVTIRSEDGVIVREELKDVIRQSGFFPVTEKRWVVVAPPKPINIFIAREDGDVTPNALAWVIERRGLIPVASQKYVPVGTPARVFCSLPDGRLMEQQIMGA